VNSPARTLGTLLGAAALVAATLASQHAASSRRARFPAEEDLLYLPRPAALKAVSLGHHELMADLVFTRAIVYFGTQFHGERQYRWLDNYLDTIVALDPHWRTPYRWAGVATMYDGRTITNPSVLESSHFLEMGVQQFPDDWELPFMLGCNYLFELKSDDPVQKAAWKRRGGEYVRHAALVGGAPSWVPLLAATILRQEGEEEAAVRHLEEVYLSTNDPRTREQVGNRLRSLHSHLDLDKAARDRQALEAAWRNTLPYAPPDLFLIVGPRPPARLDAPFLAHNPVLELSFDPVETP
jgi:hypothetical protein